MIGALNMLSSKRFTPHECAYTAHKIETEMLGLQSGIQDQLCSAYGGINYIEMFQYPYAIVSQITVPNTTWWELERGWSWCTWAGRTILHPCTKWSFVSWKVKGRIHIVWRRCA
jgi:galactokinase/mevalonate kinase-like predicted kinase